MNMSTYKVTLRATNSYAISMTVQATNHYSAKWEAERKTGLTVLSTEFIA